MHIYIYIYIYIYTCFVYCINVDYTDFLRSVYTHIDTYIHMHVYINTEIEINTEMYIYIHISIFIYIYIYTFLYLYVYIYIYTHLYICIYIYIYIYINWFIRQEGRVFANCPGDWRSIPGRVVPKTLKIVLNTSFFNTQQYKVHIKGKVEQSWKRSSALPNTSV